MSKYQVFVISNRGFRGCLDWHSQQYLFNVSALMAEHQHTFVEQGLNHVVASFEMLVANGEVEWHCYVESSRIQRMS